MSDFRPPTTGIRTPMSTEALIATIRRHVPMYRSDPEFVHYIHNLSLYLLEVNSGEIAPERAVEPHLRPKPEITPSAHAKLEKAAGKSRADVCQFCGSKTGGSRVCPHCGHMIS